MGDVGDMWNAHKERMAEESRTKKQRNLASSLAILDQYLIPYTTNNGGIHVKIEHNGVRYNFWPTTGKWQIVKKKHNSWGRGVFNLLRAMQVEHVRAE